MTRRDSGRSDIRVENREVVHRRRRRIAAFRPVFSSLADNRAPMVLKVA